MQSIKLLFPCKKVRRSHRLELKETLENKSNTINNGPLGYFELVPLDVKFTLLTYLPVTELSLLTITSKAMRNLVELYKNSSWAQKYILQKPVTHSPVVSISDQAWYLRQFQMLGSHPNLEIHARLFFRRLFIVQCDSNADRAFWLTHILKPFAMVHQARIMFLLFGPVEAGEIQWQEMCESTPVSKEQAALCFGELGNAFVVLHHFGKDWTEDDIISVMDEITSFPDEWLAENVANLLFLCGDNLTMKVLNSKAINGRVSELASIITSLCLVCVRQDQSITWVINVVNGVCKVMDNKRDKLNFLYSIIDMFREVLFELHEFSEPDDERDQDLQHMLDAQAVFCKELILMAFKHNLS